MISGLTRVASRRISSVLVNVKLQRLQHARYSQQQEQSSESGSGNQTPPRASEFSLAAFLGVGVGAALIYAVYTADPNGWIKTQLRSLYRPVQEQLVEPVAAYATNFKHSAEELMGTTQNKKPQLPPVAQPFAQKYTIVLDMDALAEYMYQSGRWVLYKRGGVDYFLRLLLDNYELVLYTKELPGSNQQALFKLDPANAYFAHVLYRDSNLKQSFDGSINPDTFDWQTFGRDPQRTIFINAGSTAAPDPNPNVITIGAAKGTRPAHSDVLLDLGYFLKKIAEHEVDDVRMYIKPLHKDVEARLKQFKADVESQAKAQEQKTRPKDVTPAAVPATAASGWSLFGRRT